ncbi:MAG: histidine phosphatase family protein, partial [Clostridia bacterium]|nr:histidine phosphatase family protein [Clostridia bacterium]
MTTLLLIRHGQSEANIKNLFAGHTDAELSPLGKQQAQVTARYIKDNYQVDRVYASDLQRAYETGKATADRYGLEVIAVEGMREIFGGDWENLSYELLEKEYAEAYDIWLHDVGN